jgi:SAM-dependent methyltransferase
MNGVALELVAPAPGERVLEIGFGGGALLRMMRARGAEVAGVDVSEAMVRRLRGFDVQVASAERLPFPGSAFDAAVSLNSLYFWPDPEAAFREIARALRPGGRQVICFAPPEVLRKWPVHRTASAVRSGRGDGASRSVPALPDIPNIGAGAASRICFAA